MLATPCLVRMPKLQSQ